MASNAGNVSIWWRHLGYEKSYKIKCIANNDMKGMVKYQVDSWKEWWDIKWIAKYKRNGRIFREMRSYGNQDWLNIKWAKMGMKTMLGIEWEWMIWLKMSQNVCRTDWRYCVWTYCVAQTMHFDGYWLKISLRPFWMTSFDLMTFAGDICEFTFLKDTFILFKFNWTLFSRVQLLKCHHWFM